MAILRISDDLINNEPEMFKFICDQFTSMEELTREHEYTLGIKRFSVQREGIPNDNTEVKMLIKRKENGELKLIWIYG
jgi:hypothetical protein